MLKDLAFIAAFITETAQLQAALPVGADPYALHRRRYYMLRAVEPGIARYLHTATDQNNRARYANKTGRVGFAEWLLLCIRHGNSCLACGQEVPLGMDHIVPFSRGGRHTIENVQPLCFPCNLSKRSGGSGGDAGHPGAPARGRSLE